MSDGEYVTYDIENEIVAELPRQPAGRFVSSADDLQDSDSGFVQFALDPTRANSWRYKFRCHRSPREFSRVVPQAM